MTPVPTLDARFSDPKARPAEWSAAAGRLAEAEVFWLTTVRPDGRPHVTPLIAVWSADALHFCTGPDERKARNLEENREVVLTTGTPSLGEGLDLVVEGEAVPVTDEARLRVLADAYVGKYGPDWRFDVRDGAFVGDGGTALVFAVAPRTVFGFAKGEPFGQTRWRF
ncbi:pyridoxamine 5'-phosphate oxidase family protein [Streptomyces sp. Je 1-79]|uniref:pyridoxamine 5'-phosphate oxidase family protein n=1 Tax=Streptomyces sp. Je 1-79 TaxID=2943847 RepID=UPI0021A3FF32|nr:pyridoxamine 5'-phosphate oxidase family protein [Streptomyces sp. Je 1-79]MCT4353000.1 pyridoxamine 5'-phosphate oxidase family protein [Streptomyces sp. Je 1-79]